MSFLLDTNVVSEWTKPRPDVGVVEFLATEDEDALFLSVITLAEHRRRNRLDDWLRNDLPARFTGRLLGIDTPTADTWGRLIARRERVGCDGWLDCRYCPGPQADIGNTRCC